MLNPRTAGHDDTVNMDIITKWKCYCGYEIQHPKKIKKIMTPSLHTKFNQFNEYLYVLCLQLKIIYYNIIYGIENKHCTYLHSIDY